MYKSKLQELCHQKSWDLPEYTGTKQGPDHNPRFHATVTVNGLSFLTDNLCKSSKEAQNEAAKLAFDHFTSLPTAPVSSSSVPSPPVPLSANIASNHNLPPGRISEINIERQQIPQFKELTLDAKSDDRSRDMQRLYKSQLQTYTQKRNLLLPVYSCEREGPPHASRFKCKVTVDGKTFESLEFFATVKEAELAAAKVALASLSPSGTQNDSALYKNLLQEMTQKGGYQLPVYEMYQSGESHVPAFVSTVEVEGEHFSGQEAKTKKQAEMNAAKVAYITLRERKSSGSPKIVPSNHQAQETLKLSSSSLPPNVSADVRHSFRPISPMPMNANIPKEQAEGYRVTVTAGSGDDFLDSFPQPEMMSSCDGGWSSSDPSVPSEPESEPYSSPLTSDCTISQAVQPSITRPFSRDIDIATEPKTEQSVGTSTITHKNVVVCPRKPNMIIPPGCTVLPMSDDNWIAMEFTS